MRVQDLQQLTEMRNAWRQAANRTNLTNVAETARLTTAAVNAVAVEMDSLDGRLHAHDGELNTVRGQIVALEQRIAHNVEDNTRSRAQRATAVGTLLAGVAGIIVFPASIYACTQTCPAGTNHSAAGCGISITACVGALASIFSALGGCCGLILSNEPQERAAAPAHNRADV